MYRHMLRLASVWDGRRVIKLRRALGLSQERFAREVGVTTATVGRWGRGLTRPKSEAILRRLEDLERVRAGRKERAGGEGTEDESNFSVPIGPGVPLSGMGRTVSGSHAGAGGRQPHGRSRSTRRGRRAEEGQP